MLAEHTAVVDRAWGYTCQLILTKLRLNIITLLVYSSPTDGLLLFHGAGHGHSDVASALAAQALPIFELRLRQAARVLVGGVRGLLLDMEHAVSLDRPCQRTSCQLRRHALVRAEHRLSVFSLVLIEGGDGAGRARLPLLHVASALPTPSVIITRELL